jgi:vancomycin resistance protein VanJ
MHSRPLSDRLSPATAVAGAAVAVVTAVALLINAAGDRWWCATLIAYGPRWIWLAPPLIAAPLAMFGNARARLLTVLSFIVVFASILHFSLPPLQSAAVHAESQAMTVVTCNLDGGVFNRPALQRVIAHAAPDVVMLQECTPDVASGVFSSGAWHVVARGGLCTASRAPLAGSPSLLERVPPRGWGAYAMDVPIDVNGFVVHAFNVHLETPRKGIEPVLERGWPGLDDLRRNGEDRAAESGSAADLAEAATSAIVAGDFNMPIDSALYRASWSRFQNAFSVAGSGFGFTKRSRSLALRIDHVLADDSWRVVSAMVADDVGSDHRPVVARLEARSLLGEKRRR